MGTATIRRVPCSELGEPLLEALSALYRAVWRFPVGSERPSRRAQEYLPQHAKLEGFRFLVTLIDERIVAYSYGYTAREGQWTSDQLLAAMGERVRTEWMQPPPFEVVTIAVDPDFQRRGIGSRLLTTLLADLLHRRAVLWTESERQGALNFYARQGWTAIVPEAEIESRWAVVLGKRMR